jgi:hypothetical protein
MDVQDHYTAWRQTQDQPSRRHGGDGPFSFCSYPFLLDPRAKSNLLHIEARFQMEQVGMNDALDDVRRCCLAVLLLYHHSTGAYVFGQLCRD